MLRDEAVLTEAIELIYDAALDPGAWGLALQRCCQLLDGAAAQIYAIDRTSRNCLYQIEHGLPKKYKEEYALHFSRKSERNILHQTRPDIDLSYDYLFYDERRRCPYLC